MTLTYNMMPYDFPMGTTFHDFYYDKVNDVNTWGTVFPNEVESGLVKVKITSDLDSNYIVQEFDTANNGFFDVNYSRTIEGNGVWSELIKHPSIKVNEEKNPKIFVLTTTTLNGSWSVDYTDMNFNEILNVQVTLQYTNHSQAERPLGAYVRNITNTSASGEAFSVTSTGLLAAMQQTEIKDGTIVHVMVIGI